MRQVTVFRRAGGFAGWPANGGLWSWGDEIVVGFKLRVLKPGTEFHAIDRNSPATRAQARSLDGGETWQLEEPAFREPAPASPASVPREAVGFDRPDFAIMLNHSGLRAGATSWFDVSYDRCRSWSGPFAFPGLGLPGVAARTDYLPSRGGRFLFFLTAAKSNGEEGRAFCARTDDSARTFEFLSWIGPEPEGFSIMPASVRLPDSRILVALRCREGRHDFQAARHWIDLYWSQDEGSTWTFLNSPVGDTGKGGNPPTLTLLHDGRLCLTYGYRAPPFGMRARLSSDSGATWSGEITLREGAGNHDLGYPRTLQRPDGTIVTMYYFNDHADGERYIAATLWRP